MKDMKKVEKQTRKIFHKLHTAQAQDKAIFNRLVKLLSTSYLQVPDDYFQGKKCLDAGCGSNANATYAMLEMGAEKVCAFDLDTSILSVAPEMLKKFEGKYELKTASVHHIPYESCSFDFVHCAGVLHHSTNIYKGLKELARVTKKGGQMFINVHGKGGIMRDFMSVLRGKYVREKVFKKFIDELDVEQLDEICRFIAMEMEKQGDFFVRHFAPHLIKQLLNKDLILTIQDRIKAPLYTQTTEKELKDWLKQNGFTKIKRISRYPRFNNIRRFLAPFYHNYDNKFARILFGEGEPQIIATKK